MSPRANTGLFAADLEIAVVLADAVEPAARVLGAGPEHSFPIMSRRRSATDHLPELGAIGAGWSSTKGASRSLGLSQWMVWNAIVTGELAATQARTRGQRSFWYVHEAELERYRAAIAPPTSHHIDLLAAPGASGVPASTLKSWRRWRGLRVIDGGPGARCATSTYERSTAFVLRRGGGGDVHATPSERRHDAVTQMHGLEP
jgi:hypothetical protein